MKLSNYLITLLRSFFAFRMPVIGWLLITALMINLFCLNYTARGEDIPFTLEDRDRIIKIEISLKEFKENIDKRLEQLDKRFEEFQRYMDKRFEQVDRRFEQIDKRFEQVDKRFEQIDKRFEQTISFMWILASILGGLVAATISFALWDRRTALAPVLRKSVTIEERQDRLERALKELAASDPRIAEALRHVGLLPLS